MEGNRKNKIVDYHMMWILFLKLFATAVNLFYIVLTQYLKVYPLKRSTWLGKIAQWLELLLRKPDNLSFISGTHNGRIDPVLVSCPLTSMQAYEHMQAY